MAQNETSVSGDVVWQDGDDLSETNLTRVAAKSNQTDYVERGLTVTVDGAAGTIDVGSGHLTVQDGINAYETFPNQQTDISLPAPNGTNHVYITIDETTDDSITVHVDDDDTPPSTPSLKIATADGSAGTATQINRGPVGDFQTVEIDGTPVIESDGKVASSAIPDLAITQTDVVADQSERLALDAEEGDVAIQEDTDETYIFTGGDVSVDSNWSKIVTDLRAHASTHERGGSDELTTFGTTQHRSTVLEQSADDGTDRHVIKRADGTEMAEIYSDGTDTVINPLTGDVNVPGTFSTEKIDSSDGYEWTDESGNRSLDNWYQAPSDRDIYFMLDVESQSDGTEIQLLVDINTTQTTNLLTSASGTFNQGLEFSIGPYRVPAGHYYKIRPARDTTNYTLTNWSELR